MLGAVQRRCFGTSLSVGGELGWSASGEGWHEGLSRTVPEGIQGCCAQKAIEPAPASIVLSAIRSGKGGRDFTINLYFDPQTFYHIASIYKLRISARMGRSPEASARQRETRLTLEEWFDDFQTRQGLELPSRWTIRFTIEGNRGTSVAKWDMAFDRALHNMSINPQLFVLE